MIEIFSQTVPFFALIALGYGSGRIGFFSEEATAYLTRFVFYFALSAMLFRFAASLSLDEIFDWNFILAYLTATMAIYIVVTLVGVFRRRSMPEVAVEAQCGVIGNVGFLGIPMLVILLGEGAVAPVILILSVDLIVFGSLIVILILAGQRGRVGPGAIGTILSGLVKNPMIVSITLGLLFARTGLAIPGPIDAFLEILGAAATPGALFAIGASLASKSAERLSIAVWLSFSKLVLHPAAVVITALFLFPVEPYAAGVMIAASALPVAGNVFILAQHYGVAPQRVSAAILVSTGASVLTVTAVIAWIKTL